MKRFTFIQLPADSAPICLILVPFQDENGFDQKETPIYLNPEDLKHFPQKLKLKIPLQLQSILTGHIDILQIRNGLIHILDFKPNARKEKPYTQLMLYALAFSRLTGLRLYDFKCAWFDENDYFEFFPLQMIHKR